MANVSHWTIFFAINKQLMCPITSEACLDTWQSREAVMKGLEVDEGSISHSFKYSFCKGNIACKFVVTNFSGDGERIV